MEAICVSDNEATYKLQKALNKKEFNVNFQFMDDGMLHQDENESKCIFLWKFGVNIKFGKDIDIKGP